MRLLISKLLVYGTLGLIIEVWFTGIHSIVSGDFEASAHTYLWMIAVYGSTALLLEQVSNRIKSNIFIKAIVYVPLIYISEFLWGLLLRHTLGKCPWDYGGSGINVLNLIRLDYGVFWYMAALGFEWLYIKMNKLIRYVGANSTL